MLRGLYFMGWYRDMWNYHPSLPIKNLHMIDDIESMQGNTLIWSSLGSGAIGLPYLDLEANDKVAPRLRLYGFLNDREFCEECARRNITVFSVLWKAQLWEFPAEFNDDETELLSLNLTRNAGSKKGFVGMSELSTNRYPKLFAPIEKYFPDGLHDFRGNRVHDFLEEFKSVSLDGRSILSAWLMASGHGHICYAPCANKDSYLAYLKKDVEMMADAGAGGLHIDEYDTQKHVLSNAGCFCDECMHKFAKYLSDNDITLPTDVHNLDSFDYRSYLKSKGIRDEELVASNGTRRFSVPLYRAFTDMQLASIEWIVRNVTEHFKDYTRARRGVAAPVTANLFQCLPHSWDSKKYLDILAGEKTQIQLRQDGWYKFAFGWANGKETCFVEDPNAYVRDVIEDIKNNIHDRFILFLLEPMAHGFHIAFPYGSWLQNQVKDAFWPDLRVTRALGTWLSENERLFPRNPVAGTAVLYDLPSALENEISEPADDTPLEVQFGEEKELGRVNFVSKDGRFEVFFNLIQKMSDANVLYNVLYVSPDEELSAKRLSPYSALIVPDAPRMSEHTATVIQSWQKKGGRLITCGRICSKLPDVESMEQAEIVREFTQADTVVHVVAEVPIGLAVHRIDGGYALHLVNYQYNEQTHHIDEITTVRLRLAFTLLTARAVSFPANERLRLHHSAQEIELENVGIYTIIEMRE